MSAEQVIDLFSPAQDDAQQVIDWVVSAGISRGRISQSTNKQVSRERAPHQPVFTLHVTDHITNI